MFKINKCRVGTFLCPRGYWHPPLKKGGILGWRGHSDTETLLAWIKAWGIEAALKKSIGMFAMALWDRQAHTLTLARDRMGEKPLYYGWQGSGKEQVFLFGSELKALKAHLAFASAIDRGALCLLLRHNYIPAPFVLSALRSKAYRSMSGAATAVSGILAY